MSQLGMNLSVPNMWYDNVNQMIYWRRHRHFTSVVGNVIGATTHPCFSIHFLFFRPPWLVCWRIHPLNDIFPDWVIGDCGPLGPGWRLLWKLAETRSMTQDKFTFVTICNKLPFIEASSVISMLMAAFLWWIGKWILLSSRRIATFILGIDLTFWCCQDAQQFSSNFFVTILI